MKIKNFSKLKKKLKEEYHKGFINGVEQGSKMTTNMIFGNFEETEGMTKSDFLEFVELVNKSNFHINYNPEKGGFTVRKKKIANIIIIKNEENERPSTERSRISNSGK